MELKIVRDTPDLPPIKEIISEADDGSMKLSFDGKRLRMYGRSTGSSSLVLYENEMKEFCEAVLLFIDDRKSRR